MAYQVAKIARRCEGAVENNHLGSNIMISVMLSRIETTHYIFLLILMSF